MTRYRMLRRFFLGVMGWTPDTLLQASLRDLVDAAEGYAGKSSKHDLPPPSFMQDMMKKHPDDSER